MTVGVLIITHNSIGPSVLAAANDILGACPLQLKMLSISRASRPEALLKQAQELVNNLDTGHGVLILTDMYGSTPSNIACHAAEGKHVQVITGLNLPMLVRVLNYSRLNLAELAQKALSGGQEGVYLCFSSNHRDPR